MRKVFSRFPNPHHPFSNLFAAFIFLITQKPECHHKCSAISEFFMIRFRLELSFFLLYLNITYNKGFSTVIYNRQFFIDKKSICPIAQTDTFKIFSLRQRSDELGSHLIKSAVRNRFPDALHQIHEIVDIVDRQKSDTKNFINVQQMPDVCACEVLAGITGTVFVDRGKIVEILSCFDRQSDAAFDEG